MTYLWRFVELVGLGAGVPTVIGVAATRPIGWVNGRVRRGLPPVARHDPPCHVRVTDHGPADWAERGWGL